MKAKTQTRRRPATETEITAAIKQEVENFHANCGPGTKALYEAMKTRIDPTKYISGYWHTQTEHEVYDWEKAWSDQYSDMIETIIGVAREYGFNPQAYLQDFWEACCNDPGTVPIHLEKFLPWNMTPAELARYRPTPEQMVAAIMSMY